MKVERKVEPTESYRKSHISRDVSFEIRIIIIFQKMKIFDAKKMYIQVYEKSLAFKIYLGPVFF